MTKSASIQINKIQTETVLHYITISVDENKRSV